MTTSPRVLIIGAGTGGLCLAHGLRRAGIDVRVYERDRTRNDGLHGYRVGINPDGSRALAQCLPPHLFDTFVATCAQPPRHLNVYTEKLRTTASFPLPEQTDPVNSEKSVSRMTLRQVLMTEMDDRIEFDRKFTHYTREDDGTVTAHFADGSHATGDVLVAADGTNSAVRRQYLPHAVTRDSGVIAIAAKVPVNDVTRALVPTNAYNGLSMVFAPKGMFCILHSMRFKWDDAGRVKNGIGGNDAELIRNWPGLLFDNTRDYLNWGLSAAADKFPDDVMRRNGTELIDTVRSMTPHWHPNLRELFRLADPGSCFPVRIRTSEPVDAWQPTNVTLLGDAIHTMTPGQGVGANTALRDAALLCRELTAVHHGGKELRAAIGDYEAEMRPYGFARVAESLAQNGTSGDAAIHRPVVGRLALGATRAFFRTNHLVPPLRRKCIDGLLDERGRE